ncbi:hypothetical protein Fmac_023330 [Flemingia macrophylla]|uniref:Uncharacterized protein n=1 Tax=Flemingia macrophylla TaxID=520843 RepID=A0ABD1LL84_9FABA
MYDKEESKSNEQILSVQMSRAETKSEPNPNLPDPEKKKKENQQSGCDTYSL